MEKMVEVERATRRLRQGDDYLTRFSETVLQEKNELPQRTRDGVEGLLARRFGLGGRIYAGGDVNSTSTRRRPGPYSERGWSGIREDRARTIGSGPSVRSTLNTPHSPAGRGLRWWLEWGRW